MVTSGPHDAILVEWTGTKSSACFGLFEASGLEYVLIGATDMSFHGVVDDPHIDEIPAADLLGDYPAVRYYPPSGDLYFDILTRLGEADSFETIEAETKEVEGTRIRPTTRARRPKPMPKRCWRESHVPDAAGSADTVRVHGSPVSPRSARNACGRLGSVPPHTVRLAVFIGPATTRGRKAAFRPDTPSRLTRPLDVTILVT